MHDSMPPARPQVGFNLMLRDPRRIVTALVLMVALVVVAVSALRTSPASSPPGASIADASPSLDDSTTSTSVQLILHVAGAVVRPGVVEIPPGSRVVDAIDAAGGATAEADVDQLSLAGKAVDGARIYVPQRGEIVVAPIDAGSGGQGMGTETVGPINLNSASQAQLESLPGIGPSLAKEIITTRERLGGFGSVDDLRRVHGIGDRRFEQLQPLVTV